MTFVDGAVLHVVESLCHRLQRLTGRTNVWLALQLTNLSIVIYFVWAVQWFLRGPRSIRPGLALFLGLLIYGLTQSVFRTPIESIESAAYSRVAKGLRNPRRLRDQFLRILFLGLSVLLAGPFYLAWAHLGTRVLLLGYSLIVLTTIVLYLLACDPLPPVRGRVWEWLEAATRVPAPVPKRAGGEGESGGRAGMQDASDDVGRIRRAG